MATYRRIWMAFALGCGLSAAPAFADEAIPAADDPSWAMCSASTAQVESEYGIPAYLLKAVALTESGRSGPDRSISSWPWTVNLNDGTPGRRFASKEEAVEFVRDRRTDGARSVDVGCMQVNIMHHPRAFTSVGAAFEPLANVRYAAQFLLQLKEQSVSWQEAIARYHSFNPDISADYAPRVLMFWQRERQQASLAPVKGLTPVIAANDRSQVILASAELATGDAPLTIAARGPAVGTASPTKRIMVWPAK